MELKLNHKQCVIGIGVIINLLVFVTIYHKAYTSGYKAGIAYFDTYTVCNQENGICQNITLDHNQIQNMVSRQ